MSPEKRKDVGGCFHEAGEKREICGHRLDPQILQHISVAGWSGMERGRYEKIKEREKKQAKRRSPTMNQCIICLRVVQAETTLNTAVCQVMIVAKTQNLLMTSITPLQTRGFTVTNLSGVNKHFKPPCH